MIIGIDLRALLSGNLSGVETYVQKITAALIKQAPSDMYVLFMNGRKNRSTIIDSFAGENVTISKTRIPNRLLNLLMTLLRWPKVDKIMQRKTGIKIDTLLVPDFRPAPVSKKVKKICVVHDLAFEHYPEFFSGKTRAWYRFINPRRELRESKKIIAVSQATADDLVKTYHIERSIIEVIHEGPPEWGKKKNDKEYIEKKYRLPKKYFLFLSTIEPRKNLPNLINGFGKFHQKHEEYHLIIAGKKNPAVFSEKELPHGEGIRYLGFIPEEDKYELMANATAFLYPSIFEGFGLPILEAMSIGTPVITSKTSSMPEVAGKAALLVSPENPDDIADALDKIITEEIQKKLKSAMPQQLKKFSWEKAAEKTHKALINA